MCDRRSGGEEIFSSPIDLLSVLSSSLHGRTIYPSPTAGPYRIGGKTTVRQCDQGGLR